MKPFSIYLVRKTSTREEIESTNFAHLTFNSKLTLYPNILVRQTDFEDKKTKNKKEFKLLLCQSFQVKKSQLEEMKVKKILILSFKGDD